MSIVVENQVKLHRFAVWSIVKGLTKKLGIKDYTIAGSYRRGEWWCNDIDLLIPVSTAAEADGIESFMLRLGWSKRPGRSEGGLTFSRQFLMETTNGVIVLDLFLAPPGCWGNALLFATGPRSFNDIIRSSIIDMGYSWSNPKYFTHIKTSKELSFNEELSALHFLGKPWIPPGKRK